MELIAEFKWWSLYGTIWKFLGVGTLDKKEDGTYEKLGDLYGTWMPDGAANIIGEANRFSFHFDSSESNGWKITLIGE